MAKLTFADLECLYKEGESCDSALFSEMRSNCLLHSSEHYKKVQEKFSRLIEHAKISDTAKLRLTKNHLQVVTKTYINNIVSLAPGIQVLPYNEKQLQDVKDAELSQAVWQDAEEKQNIAEKIDGWGQDYVVIGEMAAKVYWDPTKGRFLGYRQKTTKAGAPLFLLGDQLTTSPVGIMNEPLPMAPSDEPVFEGQLVIEPIHTFNLIRDKAAETMKASRFLCYRRMVSIKDAEALINTIEDETKRKAVLEKLTETSKTTFKVFDPTSGEYADSKGQVMFREYYFRPGGEYPNGYYYICNDTDVMFEGELPFGIFPIVVEGFDKIPTSPRCRSIIKAIRAPQAELNRLSSQAAYHSLVMGDDKIITVAGSKLSKGVQWAGLREFSVAGPAPTIINGRAGEQFEASIAREVAEIYKLANLDMEQQETQITDMQALLYKNLSQRKKYAMYVRKFERFLVEVAKTYLQLAKRYLPDDYLIKALGKREAINIAEFKRVDDNGFNIKIKPMSEDIDSMMGKQFNITQTLQYVGKDLPKEVQGRLLRMMPFLNQEQVFDYMTLDDENIDSDILALDRGEYRPANREDKHPLYIARLTHRKKQADFKLLAPEIQELYEIKINEHRQFEAQIAAELQQAQAGFIPTGGGLVKVDFYGPDGKRITLPYESIQWTVQKLEQQGLKQQELQLMDNQDQARILQAAQALNQQQSMGQSVGMQQPMPMPLTA